jgi:hypothetical protein
MFVAVVVCMLVERVWIVVIRRHGCSSSWRGRRELACTAWAAHVNHVIAAVMGVFVGGASGCGTCTSRGVQLASSSSTISLTVVQRNSCNLTCVDGLF